MLVLAEKMTSAMAFCIFMSGLTFYAAKNWSSSLDITSQTLAFWSWFICVIFVNAVGMYNMVKETKYTYAKIHSES